MKHLILTFIVSTLILLTGCTKIITTTEEIEIPQEVTMEEPEIQIDMTNKNQVIDYTIDALKNWNIDRLEKIISKSWVRFSPYSYIDIERHITLKSEDLKDAFEWTTQYVRWAEDGTGDPILLTFKWYLKKYVYDIDFQKLAEKNYDNIVQRWNTINNIDDIYSWASTVEFFIPGINPEYEWMDRRSLTLVLQLEDNKRKLRAIVHNQWTI